MLNRKFFYDYTRQQLFNKKLKQSQVDGMNAILDEWETNYNKSDDRWLAYMLATTFHETAATMQPIEEYGKGKTRPYGKRLKMGRDKNGNRIPYSDTNEIFYGRGFVQLTWYENYKKAGQKLGVDFMHNASGVMDLKIATKILFVGMIEGWFTARKLKDYFSPTQEDWREARRIINGLDKANLIKQYALHFYAALSYTN